ncbi:MAG: hypothetical protein IT379_25670 [Deltaproteobacteria bacterium]|nr:hypothetical protein [Deltaproteobacteria bacterium]
MTWNEIPETSDAWIAWARQHDAASVETAPAPAPSSRVDAAEAAIGALPPGLRELWEAFDGCRVGALTILSSEAPSLRKRRDASVKRWLEWGGKDLIGPLHVGQVPGIDVQLIAVARDPADPFVTPLDGPCAGIPLAPYVVDLVAAAALGLLAPSLGGDVALPAPRDEVERRARLMWLEDAIDRCRSAMRGRGIESTWATTSCETWEARLLGLLALAKAAPRKKAAARSEVTDGGARTVWAVMLKIASSDEVPLDDIDEFFKNERDGVRLALRMIAPKASDDERDRVRELVEEFAPDLVADLE